MRTRNKPLPRVRKRNLLLERDERICEQRANGSLENLRTRRNRSTRTGEFENQEQTKRRRLANLRRKANHSKELQEFEKETWELENKEQTAPKTLENLRTPENTVAIRSKRIRELEKKSSPLETGGFRAKSKTKKRLEIGDKRTNRSKRTRKLVSIRSKPLD